MTLNDVEALEGCLKMFGWVRSNRSPQYLRNDDLAQEEILFHHPQFHYSVFALNPLVDNKAGQYASWGFYHEGTLTKWGSDDLKLLTFLSRIPRE